MRQYQVGATTAVAAAGGYAALYRLGQTWGATDHEQRQVLAGDELLPDARARTTHAITIQAPPAAVWPWLVQMGWRRAGWYTYRWVDRLLFPANGPSADRILPEHQRLATAFDKLVKRGITAILSNSDTPETRELYRRFKPSGVQVRRPINSVASRRGAVSELLVVSK